VALSVTVVTVLPSEYVVVHVWTSLADVVQVGPLVTVTEGAAVVVVVVHLPTPFVTAQ
jgi:hypothetical protein